MDKIIIEILKEIAFVNPNESLLERSQRAVRVQELLAYNGYSDWVKSEMHKNVEYIIGSKEGEKG